MAVYAHTSVDSGGSSRLSSCSPLRSPDTKQVWEKRNAWASTGPYVVGVVRALRSLRQIRSACCFKPSLITRLRPRATQTTTTCRSSTILSVQTNLELLTKLNRKVL